MDTVFHKFTTVEALQFLRRAPKGSKFALSVRLDAVIEDNDNQVFPDGCATWLNLSRTEALAIAGRMLSSTLEAKGGRIPMRTTRSSFDLATTFWLG